MKRKLLTKRFLFLAMVIMLILTGCRRTKTELPAKEDMYFWVNAVIDEGVFQPFGYIYELLPDQTRKYLPDAEISVNGIPLVYDVSELLYLLDREDPEVDLDESVTIYLKHPYVGAYEHTFTIPPMVEDVQYSFSPEELGEWLEQETPDPLVPLMLSWEEKECDFYVVYVSLYDEDKDIVIYRPCYTWENKFDLQEERDFIMGEYNDQVSYVSINISTVNRHLFFSSGGFCVEVVSTDLISTLPEAEGTSFESPPLRFFILDKHRG